MLQTVVKFSIELLFWFVAAKIDASNAEIIDVIAAKPPTNTPLTDSIASASSWIPNSKVTGPRYGPSSPILSTTALAAAAIASRVVSPCVVMI